MGSFTIQDLSFTYPERDKPALSHVSMTIADGDFVVLCGAPAAERAPCSVI